MRFFNVSPSPTRIKSRGTLLPYSGGIVTPPCPVTTRSSVPGSTVRATGPGSPSPPPHQLWCQRDSKAKLVTAIQAPSLIQSPLILISHLPPRFSPLCLAFPCLPFGSSWWLSVCVERDVESISLFSLPGHVWFLSDTWLPSLNVVAVCCQHQLFVLHDVCYTIGLSPAWICRAACLLCAEKSSLWVTMSTFTGYRRHT